MAQAREPLHTQRSLEIQQQTQVGAAPQAFYGMHFRDDAVAGLAKKVIWLSVAAMAAVIVTSVFNLLTIDNQLALVKQTFIDAGYRGDQLQQLMDAAQMQVYFIILANVLFGFCIPCCGFQGAKGNDKNLMCCFCGCNIFNAISIAYSLIVVVGLVSDGYGLGILSMVISAVMFVLYSASGFYGYKLWDHLGQGHVITMAPAYPAMITAQVQPGYVAYPQPGQVQPGGQPAYPAAPAYPVAQAPQVLG